MPAWTSHIEKKPPKIKYYYYKQYPFGRRAGKQNPFGEANEVSLRVMNKAHQWWDSKYPDRQWEDMGIGERQGVILAFLRDPDTKILGEVKENKEPHHIGWKNYGIDDYIEDALQDYEESEEGKWDYIEGDNGEQEHRSELERARDTMEAEKELLDTSDPTYPISGGMDFQEGGERVIDEPRTGDDFDYVDWSKRREKERDTDEKARDYLEKIKYSMDKGGAKFQRGEELSLSDMTEEEMEALGKKESEPHQAEEDYEGSECNICGLDEDEHNENTGHEFTPAIIAEEGGKGSGKKDHKGWMRAIEEEHTYDFCENCNMITEQVNNKCDMCGKQVE